MGIKDYHVKILNDRYAVPYPMIEDLEDKDLLKSLTHEESNNLLNRNDLDSGSLRIGYPNHPKTFTLRLNNPLISDEGMSIKYLRPVGQENRLYIPDGIHLKEEDEIWITEGELKALSCSIRGLPVVAISGIWGWRGNRADSVTKINDLLDFGKRRLSTDREALIGDLHKNWKGKHFVLVYDSDITQKHPAWEAFPRLAEQLYLLGAETVKIISCPMLKDGNNGKKIGLDDLFVAVQKTEGYTDQDIVNILKRIVTDTEHYIPLKDGSGNYVKKILSLSNHTTTDKLNGAISVLAAEGEAALEDYIEGWGKGHGFLKKQAFSGLKKVMERQKRGIPDKVSLSQLKRFVQEAQTLYKNEKVHMEIDKDKIYTLIINSLKDAGDFFRSSNSAETWYFNKAKKEVMELNGTEFQSFFTEVTGASVKSDYGKSVISKIRSNTCIKGDTKSVYRLCCFNPITPSLYLDLNNGEILKLDGESITKVPMGTDGIYFVSSIGEEWDYVDTCKEDETLFLSTILGSKYSPISKLKASNAVLVDLTWKLTLFFREIQPTRAIMLYLGEKGSGKSNTARVWLKTVFGESAEVFTVLKSNQEQMVTLLTNRPLICLDNLDSSMSWFLDTLATAATGGKIPKRILYTTNEMAEYDIISWIMITSRTPKLHRDDIVERLLTIHLDKLDGYIPEGELMKTVCLNRNKFMSIIANLMNEIVGQMNSDPSWQRRREQFRLADFASFLRLFLTTALGEKGGELTDEVLQELTSIQEQFFIEEDPLIQIIQKLMNQKKLKMDKGYKSQELVDLINEEAARSHSNFRIHSPRSLTSMINERKRSTEKLFNLQITEGNTHGYKTYKFKLISGN